MSSAPRTYRLRVQECSRSVFVRPVVGSGAWGVPGLGQTLVWKTTFDSIASGSRLHYSPEFESGDPEFVNP